MEFLENKDQIRTEIATRLNDFVSKNFRNSREVAGLLNINESSLSHYINGNRELNPRILRKLNQIGCNIEWLLTGKESPKTINNESPISGKGNTVSNLQGKNEVVNKIAVSDTVELEVLREKVKYLEDKNKLLDEIITDLRKQNNYLLQKLTGGEK
jgi:transcriptional regulator with XRE-family HTH domain